MDAPAPPESATETEVRRIRELIETRRFDAALAAAQTLTLRLPGNRDALYLCAVPLRYLGRAREALEVLARLEALAPRFGRAHQERGHCHLALGEPQEALRAFQRAVTHNPALVASWKALRVLHRAAGQPVESAAAAEQIAALERLPPAVRTASGMLAEGDLPGAERLLREFLLRTGDHPEAMRLLAQIGIQLGVLDDAETLLEHVLAARPEDRLAHYDYAVVLSRRQRHAQALEEARKLLAAEPGHAAFRTLYATCCVGLGRHEEALRIYRELLAASPDNPELHLSVGHALKTLGEQEQAIEAYRRAAQARPSFGDAYWSLANLKTYRFPAAEIARMRAEESAPSLAPVDRYHLCFALGKALEENAEYAESFRYYSAGNALKRSELRYDIEPLERAVSMQIELAGAGLFAARAGWGCPRPDPIFIVGLPRAGSTLIEQILASHSRVEGTMELPQIPRLVHRLNGRELRGASGRYPQALADLTAAQCHGLGEQYLEDTRAYRTGRPFFIDKMPNNWRHVGLLQLILPQAKIIDARRHPMACCFSNFKQLFASGQEFTYGLEDIARYYRAYVRLMAHWDQVLPGKVLRVQYEQLVDDLEGQVRRILDHLGLPFEPACLEFHATARSVRTASSEQVRRPLYREGLDQWRRYEPWLAELRAALGPLADDPQAAPGAGPGADAQSALRKL
jgi:tetratricopeptide (TPR) repeat protein